MAAAASSSSSSHPSTSLINPRNKYDVFLSFRGEDTRDNFTSHLYSALCQQSIETFIDNDLKRGDEISKSLLDAIEASTISLVIFSEGYASSRWCLDELVKILECKTEYNQIVIPVFYGVDPSHVRKQTGTFGDFFSKLQGGPDKIQKWKTALTEAANLSGFPSRNIRPESELVKKVVNDILKRLAKVFPRYKKDQLVGVESTIWEIESLLEEHYTLGIWGFGGIGKTTIARAVFDKISNNFDGSCFLQNVRKESESPGGLACLQRKLVSRLLLDENVIPDMEHNIRRLSRMKVLIVLDDVTSVDKKESLIERLDWFRSESRIIITSRNKQVLRNWGVKKIYKVKVLGYDHALELFSRHAFKQKHPNEGYKKQSDKIISYAGGVPLALKVLGCYLFEKEIKVWESALKKLETILHQDIQEILKISYDSLDDKEKNIFLDIACFFNGTNVDLATEFLDACDFFGEIGISVLVDMSLVSISVHNHITMHDLIQKMGREIVRQESVNDPGKRSRLWHYEDIIDVLTNNTGTEAVEGICLDMSKVKEIHIDPRTFTKMRKLRFLKFYSSITNGENKCKVSYFQGPGLAEVRYLHWHGYPLKSLPSNSHLEKLVSLEMPHSNIEQLWNVFQHHGNLNQGIPAACRSLTQHPNKLVILNLRECKSLKSIPAITHLEFLKELDLSGCSKLKRLPEISSRNIEKILLQGTAIEELPSSIECLSRLLVLNLQDCRSFKSLPSSLCELKSLECLNLDGCLKLQRLPDEFGNLEALRELCARRTAIREVPSSIECLSRLYELKLKDCRSLKSLPSSLCKLKSLKYLNLDGCLKLQSLPDELGNLEALVDLSAEGTAIREVPSSIECLSRLYELHLKDCRSLKSLPSSLCKLKSLASLNLDGCLNLQSLPDELGNLEALGYPFAEGTAIREVPPSIECLSRLFELQLQDCRSLKSLPSSLCKLKSLASLNLDGCLNLQSLPDELGNLEALVDLSAEGTAIREVPSSIECLSRLSDLKLKDCRSLKSLPSSLCKLKSLASLNLDGCLKLQSLPDELGNLEALVDLSAEGTAIREVPSSIECLSRLFDLKLKDCRSLKSLPSSLCKLKSLKYLNLDGCLKLQSLPDELGNLEALVDLSAEGTAIREVPSSIECLSRLYELHLKDCRSLKSLPSSLCKLKSLNYLNLDGCLKLQRLPDELGNLEALKNLYAVGAGIREVPSSIVCLQGLTELQLTDCGITELPESLGQISSLVSLSLSKNNLETIPESIIQLSKLSYLIVRYCEKLQSLPNLPRNLFSLDAHHCSSLETVSSIYSDPKCVYRTRVRLSDTFKLDGNELRGIVGDTLQTIQLRQTERWKQLREVICSEDGSVFLPGNEIPKWFRFQNMGSSLTLKMPTGLLNNKEVIGFAFCAVVAFPDHYGSNRRVEWQYLYNCEHDVYRSGFHRINCVVSDHLLLGAHFFDCLLVDRIRNYNCVPYAFCIHFTKLCSFEPLDCCPVKKCGIQLLHAPDEILAEISTEPHPKRLKYSG